MVSTRFFVRFVEFVAPRPSLSSVRPSYIFIFIFNSGMNKQMLLWLHSRAPVTVLLTTHR